MTDRSIKRYFGRPVRRMHLPAGFFSSILLILVLIKEFLLALPQMLYFRLINKPRFKRKSVILIFSDNLDEVNGIANNIRLMVTQLRKQGKPVWLAGTTYHTRPHGFVEVNGTILASGAVSMEQLGYEGSEVSIPRLRDLLQLLRKVHVPLVELETPSAGAWLILVACKVMKIKVISHYRTDILSYTKMLVQSQFTYRFVYLFTRSFCQLTTPVIVPSKHFKQKMIEEMRLKPSDVVQLKRGIELDSFNPDLRVQKDLWEQWFKQTTDLQRPCRFLYVGRISREKELDFLAQVWDQVHLEGSQLLLVGHGPYAVDLQKRFSGDSRVAFAGTLTGVELATVYAQADYFLFPSGTDTFGNVVVEALASGTPCLVSDSGGPAEILEQCSGGWVLPFRNLAIWSEKMVLAQTMFIENQDAYIDMREHAFQHSRQYAIESAAQGLWAFYEKYLDEQVMGRISQR